MVNFVLGTVATLAALAPLAAAAPAPAATQATEIFSFVKWVDGIIANPNGDNLSPEEAVEAYYKSVNASKAASLDWDYGRARKRENADDVASPDWDYGKRDTTDDVASPDWDYGKRDNTDDVASPDWDYGKRDNTDDVASPDWDYGKRDNTDDVASPDWDYGRLRKRVSCNTISGTQASVPDAVACINYLASLGSTACVVNVKSTFCTIGNAQITGITGNSIPTSSSCNDVARGAGYIMDACTLADNTVQGSEFAYGNGNLLVWIRKPE